MHQQTTSPSEGSGPVKPVESRGVVQKRIVIQHPVMRDANDATVEEFGRLLVAGLERWLTRLGGDPQQGLNTPAENASKKASELIRPSELLRIASAQDPERRRQLLDELMTQMRDALQSALSVRPIAKSQGRKRIYGERDAHIFELRKSGLSYGQIANKLRMGRTAVQAAYRRDAARRQAFYCQYVTLKKLLSDFGIILRERCR